jgi:hypothetical protein
MVGLVHQEKKMKTLVTMIVIAIAFSLAMIARANDIEFDLDHAGKTCMEINLATDLNHHVGLFAYSANKTGWGEAYVGPTLSIPHLQIGIAAGMETGQTDVRFGGYIWAGKGNCSFLALGEDGGSGPFYRLEGKYQLDSKDLVGLLQEKNQGTGILVERKLDKTVIIRARFYGGGSGDVGIKLAF